MALLSIDQNLLEVLAIKHRMKFAQSYSLLRLLLRLFFSLCKKKNETRLTCTFKFLVFLSIGLNFAQYVPLFVIFSYNLNEFETFIIVFMLF